LNIKLNNILLYIFIILYIHILIHLKQRESSAFRVNRSNHQAPTVHRNQIFKAPLGANSSQKVKLRDSCAKITKHMSLMILIKKLSCRYACHNLHNRQSTLRCQEVLENLFIVCSKKSFAEDFDICLKLLFIITTRVRLFIYD